MNILAITAATIAVIMLALWLISLPIKNASIVDIFWGSGFVVIATVCWFLSTPQSRGTLMWILVAIWGLRLSFYLAWRNLGHGEDRRYRSMRDKIGPQFWWISLLVVFGLQGVIMFVVSLPVQLTIQADSPNSPAWNLLDAAGIIIWLAGLIFESVGDYQMARFKADKAESGNVMDRGLWRYTRHPNYFGDFLIWWGIFLIAMAGDAAWWAIAGPLLMSFLLMRVSGVTLLEKGLSSRLEGYQQYVQSTNAFFPWIPKRDTDKPAS